MAKKIRNPIEGKFTVSFEEGVPSYHIDDVSAHYGITCEHEVSMRRGLPLDQNNEILNIVKDFVEEAIKQVDAHKEIPGEDSLLDANGEAQIV